MQIVVALGQIYGSFNSSGETIPLNIMNKIQLTTDETRIFNSYCTILLGEIVPLTLTIAGKEVKQPRAGTHFTRKTIRRIMSAHAKGDAVQVTLSEAPQRLSALLEQPLPADITPDNVTAYYQSL
jgi:hypothetical protein